MNTAIYKYQLSENVVMPKGAKLLKVAFQKTPTIEAFYVWALVDLENKDEIRNFQIIGTGCHLIDNNLLIKPTYIGSALGYNDKLVLHIFENVKLKP